MTQPVLCGPPFLNGELHGGHCVNFVVKDFVNRYNVLKNKKIDYFYIFDAQGLPVEYKVKKNQKEDINQKDLVKKCLGESNLNLKKALKMFPKLGLLEPYNTLVTTEVGYKVSLMNYLLKLYRNSNLKRKEKILDYCENCDAILANAELEYTERKNEIFVFKAKLLEGNYQNYNLLFATTQPETILFNHFIALRPEKTYYVGTVKKSKVIVGSKELLEVYEKDVKAEELEGLLYEIVQEKISLNIKSKIILTEYVQDNTSTEKERKTDLEQKYQKSDTLRKYACVQLSCFAKTDYELVSKKKLLDQIGIEVTNKTLLHVHQQQKKIKEDLTLLTPFEILKKEIKKVPICWKCKKDTIETCTEQFFLELSLEDRKAFVEEIEKVGLNNENFREVLKRWFSSEVDWCISRNRPYGTPLPFGQCENVLCKKKAHLIPIEYVHEDFKSAELCYYPFLDEVLENKKLLCEECGTLLKALRVSVDVWVDSGFLPIFFKEKYDMFIEGKDQIKGWFYTTAFLKFLENREFPYKNLVFMGWLLKEKNVKLSKSAQNYESMDLILDRCGLLNFRSYAVSKANSKDTPFASTLILQQKKYINNLSNIASFLKARVFEVKSELRESTKEESDRVARWKKETEELVLEVEKAYEELQFSTYWDLLKNFMLKKYSREYINLSKKDENKQTVAFFRNTAQRLFRYIEPVLGLSLLKDSN